ncbi:hypothetical protein diail_5266 [Diaporthe ilicicola]|nr:hypothetical protein diail_5266 [Diaporthe ilicicola]
MSTHTLRDAGFKAIEQRKWPEAIEALSKAIDQSKSPAWLLARSQAYMETGQLDKAIRDAEYAYCTAAERGNDRSRQQMIEASHRRSVCYFRQKEYANADICAVWSQRLAKGVAVKEAKNVQQEGVNEKGYYFATVEQALAEGKNKKPSGGGDQMAKLSELMSGGSSDKTPYAKDWNKAQVWRSQVLRFLEVLPDEEPARKITTSLTPVKPSLDDQKQVRSSSPDDEVASDKSKVTPPKSPDADFRTQFYQTDQSITVSVFMKFSDKEAMDKVDVRFSENGKIMFVVGVPREIPWVWLEFYDLVDTQKSTHRVASMKLEFTLVKKVPGKWPDFGTQSISLPNQVGADPDTAEWFRTSLARIGKEVSDNGIAGLPKKINREPDEPSAGEGLEADLSTPPTKMAGSESFSTASTATESKGSTVASEPAKAPLYPTSSKFGPKDWDSIAKDEDEEDATDVDHFFKQLYKNSTPEQQRAMMKSYTESNGTALSTDWSSVAKGKVETTPPTGMQAKKWGS